MYKCKKCHNTFDIKKKADISGQVINDILNLIHTTGGATYNLSKGNLVGTNAFAVAIYPDKEQIVDEVDFENLENYIVQNESLLSNPNNSFGAWGSSGKTYFDVVATVPNKEQAIQLGQQHGQLAIFDLKNLTEIPLQRTASFKTASSNVYEINGVRLYKNPTPDQAENIFLKSHHGIMRYFSDGKDVYIWDAYKLTHEDAMALLGIELTSENYAGAGVIHSPYQARFLAERYMGGYKQAAAVSDREQQKYYDEIYSDRWRDDSSPIDGGFEYNKGWSELNGNDYPSPKDLDKERALLDQLEKPINRNMPTGLGEYAITYYDAFPDQGDQGGV